MTKSKGIRRIRTEAGGTAKYNIGDIIIRPNGTRWKVGEDRKWVYIKKPKGYFKKDQPKPQKPKPVFPSVNLPDHIKPTNYPRYYISNDGIAYREPRRCDENGRFGEVNEWGLIEITTQLRGNSKDMNKRYDGLNIYFYDENDKNIGNKKKNIHQLVAETWVPNPHGYTEILHLDENPRNNHYTNLKWGTHKENMSVKALPDGTRRRTHGKLGSLYEKKNGEWVLIPKVNKKTGKRTPWNKGKKFKMPEGYQTWNTLPDGSISKDGQRKKINGKWVYQKKEGKRKSLPDGSISKDGQRKKINGKWVYQKKERVDINYESTSDSTITTRADGTKWKKENGKWVYQKKLKKD